MAEVNKSTPKKTCPGALKKKKPKEKKKNANLSLMQMNDLITSVQHFPILYDNTKTGHAQISRTDPLWENIAQEVGCSGK